MTLRLPDLRVGAWLGIGLGAATLVLVGAVALAITLLGRISAEERRLARDVVPRGVAARALETEVLRLGLSSRAHALARDEATLAVCRDARERFGRAQASFVAMPRDPAGAEIAAEIAAVTDEYARRADALVALVGSPDATAGELAEAQQSMIPERDRAIARIQAYAALLDETAAATRGRIEGTRRGAVGTLLAAAVVLGALLAATALVVGRGVRVPAQRLARATRRLGEGDYRGASELAAPPDGPAAHRNELAALGRTFARMALDLEERDARIRAQAEELRGRNDELQAQREELQARNEELQAKQQELQVQAEDLREHDERLRASEERYRHLFQNLNEGFSLHEMVWGHAGEPADYRFLEVNPAFERLTGLTRERAIGHTVRELLPGIEPEWLDRFGEVARTRRPLRFEAWSGSLGRWFEVMAFSPETGQFATLFFDATERRAAEQALREADRRKDEFLALLSHELRNPLAPVVAGLHVLSRTESGTPENVRARAVIQRQVGHLVRLVDDLLDVTRVTRGKVHLRRARVDLGALAAHVAEDNAPIFAERGIALEVDTPPGPLQIDADGARIAQVLGNLLQNAAKFTPEGGRVSLRVAEDGGRAVVAITDTGVGIPGDVLPRLFQPFMQAESSLARTSGGLGLGLALVKGLVELHGGSVRVESEGAGLGSRFTVELPLDKAATPIAAAPPAADGPRRRVLVVEDNEDAAETLADALRLGGHEVEVARDGYEGVRRATEWRPQAVLCDIGLPGIDGYEVARRLRAAGIASEALLVAVTGYALPEDLRRCREAGFDAHLAKPARLEDIEALLARAGRARAGGA